MSHLVSILMPTRNSHESLWKALQSIKDSATDFSQVQILLRMDDDDGERIKRIPELESQFNAKVVIGPRGVGYLNMGQFLDDLAAQATGRWSWLFDDDAHVDGPWQQQLSETECSAEGGPALNSEFYKLGESRYSNWPKVGPPGLIIPTAAAKTLQHRAPVDDQWLSVAQQLGWPIKLLKGVTYHHCGRAR